MEQIKKYLKKTQPGIKDEQIFESYEIPIDLDYYDVWLLHNF